MEVHEVRVNLADPVMTEEMIGEAERVLREEFFLGGETVQEFEAAFADYVGTDHAIAVDSGTSALHLSLLSLDISEGDTVLTVPATFIASANVITRTGATPEFVDISLGSYTMDLDEVEAVLAEREIDAILPIHLYGHPVDMPALAEIARDVPIVSDACQAHGAAIDGGKIGSYADLGAFSFYPSKNMTVAGDGGMVTTDDDELAERIRSLRDVGRTSEAYLHERIGFTARLNTVNAAIGKEQLHHLDGWNRRRMEIAARYRGELGDVGDLVHPPAGDERTDPAWYFYTIRSSCREELARHLEERDIETGKQYEVPVHEQPPYRERGYGEESYRKTEQWADELLTIPVHQHLTEEQVNHVIDSITGFFENQ